ncbi:lipopolysaccharide biosynthesis protein [Chthonobacter rhizosphaerae]|uniref:lipopolysaccharide biosynthesis protein n=1 Tax=Chthonobacter rhizosphaerae TaxID=2735553 RepID=UPI0015EF3FAE|nr:lipopolysaccharide biosynthesis protein [Chthonobacter rhizosphaerae]
MTDLLLAPLRRLLPATVAGRVDALLGAGSQAEAGRTALAAFALRVAGAAIAYLSQVVLARWMGMYEYGIFVVVYVWITILSQIGNLGFSSSVIRFIPEYRATGDLARLWGVLRASRLAAAGFSTGLAAVGALAAVTLPGAVDEHYVLPILLGAVCLPLFCLTEVQDGIARSFAWSDLAFGPTYIWRPVGVLAVMVAFHEADLPMTAVTACLAMIVATWITALGQLVGLRRRVAAAVERRAARTDWRVWLGVSLPILLVDGFYALLTSVDVLMISHFGTPEDVAVYYAATKTLALVHFVAYAVRAASGPRFAYDHYAGDRVGLEAMVRTAVRWTFWPSVAVSTLVLLVGDRLLALFGADFAGGAGLLVILVFGILARASIGPVETLLTLAGRQTTCAAIFGVALAVNVALNLVLIPAYGLYGAAAATAVAMVAEALLLAAAVRRHFGLTVFVFRLPPRNALTAARGSSA